MVVLRSLAQLLLPLWLASGALNHGAIAPFTNCIDILNLSPEEANQNHPARIKGVITCFVPVSQLCFVQDGTAGLYVFPSPWPKDLSIGSIVEVEGVTGPGRFAPILQSGRIQPTGEKQTLEPKRISIEDLGTGAYDCQFVELEGVVRSFELGNNVANLHLFAGGSSITVLFFEPERASNAWIDARLKLRGVAGTFYDGDRLSGFGLFVQNSSGLEILEPAVDPFTRPLRNLSRLLWFSPDGAMDHRIRVRGTVTLRWPGDSFFIQDQFGSIRVLARDPAINLVPGDLVEVAGFLNQPTSRNRSLENAVWKRTGSAPLPLPQNTDPGDLLLQPADGRLVTTEGTAVGVNTIGGISVLLLEHDGQAIHAFLQKQLPQDLPGATIRITGAWSTPPAALLRDAPPGIWLASIDHLTLLKPSAPRSAARGSAPSGIALATAFAGLLIGGALTWRGYAASRQAASEKESAREQLHHLDRQLTQLKEGRERLGRDLHDHIIQSIYAVGLKIEDCRQMLNDPAKAEPRLNTALADINSVIRELRNVILGLETNAIQPGEFRTALKSLGLTLGKDDSNRLRLDIDQVAIDSLNAHQATELIHIAREAMSNNVRHGRAPTTTFSLHLHTDSVRFTIEDDGCGFDPSTEQSKGYGLRNMAKRADALGAKFTIQSRKGAGTRIVLDIPIQKQHFSSGESRSPINR